VGHGSGHGGSQWRTTLWVYNPSASDIEIKLAFMPRNKASVAYVLAAGETRRFDDVVATVFSTTGYGAIRVTADDPVVVSSRIYNQSGSDPSDTQGQLFNGLPDTFAIGLGESTDVIGVNQWSDGAFRYNFGIVNISVQPVTVQVTLLDSDGTTLGARAYSLDEWQAIQVGLADIGAGSMPTDNGRLHFEVTDGEGRALAFGSGVANTSQDPTTFEMTLSHERSGSGPQTTAGPNVRRAASEVCDSTDCSTPKRTLDAIANWIAGEQNGIYMRDDCGEHRFALAAEQLAGPAETPDPGEPWSGACWSGCVQFGLMFTAIANQLGIDTRYVGTVREDTKALLESGCWPGDYGITFQGHYFTKSWNGSYWLYYDPPAHRVADYQDGVFIKTIQQTPYYYYVYAVDRDPWNAGFHNQQELRQTLETMFCPNGSCNNPSGTCPD
jgi:hypothetical protein